MVATRLAPKWMPLGIVQRLRNLAQEPGDTTLALYIGVFLWRLPRQMDRMPLPRLLDRLSAGARPDEPDVRRAAQRIARLRQPWLNLSLLRNRSTCYMRALTLYRFLPARERTLRIHFGVEPGIDSADRLRGHAWVTVDGEIFEPPDPLIAGRVREIYCHPPEA